MTCKACTHYKGKVSLHKKDTAGKPRRHWVMVCHMIGYVEILPPKFTGVCTAYAPPVGRANKNSGGFHGKGHGIKAEAGRETGIQHR
jgi:hypothetical protein